MKSWALEDPNRLTGEDEDEEADMRTKNKGSPATMSNGVDQRTGQCVHTDNKTISAAHTDLRATQ